MSVDEALSQADFVSVHVPLLREGESSAPTYHLFNERTLRRMKPTAFLVNTSRGPVVDEAALAKALRENWIAGAALDVYEKEPLPADSPLRDPAIEDRCRLLPHFASAGRITRLSSDPDKGMAGRTVQGLIDVLEGNYGGDRDQDALRGKQRGVRQNAERIRHSDAYSEMVCSSLWARRTRSPNTARGAWVRGSGEPAFLPADRQPAYSVRPAIKTAAKIISGPWLAIIARVMQESSPPAATRQCPIRRRCSASRRCRRSAAGATDSAAGSGW